MIRASKNSSLHQGRSKLLRSVAHQRETRRDFGLKPVTAGTISLGATQCDTYLVNSVAVVAAVAAVVAAVLVLVALAELYFVS
jgi:hypothetical protein